MINRHIIGKEVLTLAVIAALVMAAVAFFVDTPAVLPADAGLCFPSPDQWKFPAFFRWLFNTALIGAVAVLLSTLNKEYRLIPGSDTIFLGMFLIMAVSNVWISGLFTTSSILAVVNLICMLMLFSCYDRYNSTKDLFVIGTLMSFGSMFQYAFIFMAPVYLIGAIIMKCFDIKVLIAYLMGLAAPYWIVLGFGIVSPDAIHFTRPTHIFAFVSKGDMVVGFLNVGLTVALGVLLTLSNTFNAYTGNSKKRACNAVINLLGIFLLACMIFDFENLVVYLSSAYFITAFQLGKLFETGNLRRPEFWLLGITAVYLILYILMLI